MVSKTEYDSMKLRNYVGVTIKNGNSKCKRGKNKFTVNWNWNMI